MDGIPAPGEILAEKYRVEALLGQGGMGVVLLVHHLRLDEPVAVKLLREDLSRSRPVVERFLREARAAARIKSEHVVRVMDVDLLPSGAPYLVMERLVGRDLASIVQSEGPLDPARAARHVREACEALAEAHALGVVHRDLKPSNLFVARRFDGSERTKVLDFGVSKLAGAEELTSTGVSLGTPSYMAPEQLVSARTVDARADLWALGVVLYKLVTGTVPFRAATAAELGMSILLAPPVPPRDARPELPEAFEAVILRCLEKDPSMRFATAQALSAALAPFADGAADRPPALAESAVRSVPDAHVSTLSQEPAAPAAGRAGSAPARAEDQPSTAPGVHVPGRATDARPPVRIGFAIAVAALTAGGLATVMVSRDTKPDSGTVTPITEAVPLAAPEIPTALDTPPPATVTPAPAISATRAATPTPTQASSAAAPPAHEPRPPLPRSTASAAVPVPSTAAPVTTGEDPFAWKRK